ncbi:Methylated-DNA--protein-cysteine methyltransferase [bioreactor metagenome]|uniref:Methylated-DNA--protein-cysteine methyltransferase n=1 Tax=bioreactor metagenome TaxID=1076179 RepID=A0A645CR76_9ZZZZ
MIYKKRARIFSRAAKAKCIIAGETGEGGCALDSFFDRVYRLVKKIPRGKVASYGQIAMMLDSPRAARQVGWAMRRSPKGLPWQRVVMADGSIAGGVDPEACRAILRAEGVAFLPDGRVDMRTCRWNGRKRPASD